MSAPVLTRDLLETGELEAMITRDAPHLRLWTPDERETSLQEMLKTRPGADIWVFGYGSLIWNPAIRTAERRTATVKGWHRSFCLSITAGRGSSERPGLMLALDAGGTCVGSAFRIAEQDVERELSLLWQREMLCGAYVPRWIDVYDQDGRRFGTAIAFTIDPACNQYTGRLDMDAIVHRLAAAKGGLGTGADYLLRTRDGLRAHGIPDAYLERLAARLEVIYPAVAPAKHLGALTDPHSFN
jgi:cation transport protein ChaC